MPKYVSVAEMKLVLIDGSLIDLTAYSDDQVEEEILTGESIVERITGNIFTGEQKTRYFDGAGLTRQFFLPSVTHMLAEVTTLKDVDIDGTTVLETYTEGTDFVRYDHFVEVALALEDDSPRRIVTSGGVWPTGQKNIEINGIWAHEAAVDGEGTITVSTGALTTLDGTSTRFLRDFRVGNLIKIDSSWYTIATITSDILATISTNFSGTLDVATAYTHFRTPYDIRKAVRMLVGEALESGSMNVTDSDVRQAVWPDFTVTLKGKADEIGMATGYPEVDRLLANHINYAGMFAVPGAYKHNYDRATSRG